MRRPTLLLMLILLFLHTHAQKKKPVEFYSDDRKLCVIPQGGLVITTKAGDVAVTDSLNGYWWEIHPSYGPVCDNILKQGNFFNRDTGFVSGLICEENEEYNIIYHTQDGGASWTPINFGVDGQVDDVCNLDNGEAWLSVAGKGIIYTTNYGLSWKRLSNPDTNQFFTHIYFNTKREGFIGSTRNILALTLDNCVSWKTIPTPLDQKKYNKTNLESQPEIIRTAIFKDYLLVKQEELVFYTKRDTIRWTALPDYSDFYTDASNSALFFKLASGGGFIKADSAMQPIFKADIKQNSFDASCKNGNLFVVTKDEVIQLHPDNTVRASFIHTNWDAEIEPEYIGFELGAIGNKIYKTGLDTPWVYVLTLPFNVDSGRFHALEGNRFVYYNEDSVYYYSMANKQVEKKDIREMLRDFWKPGIKNITYFKGSGIINNNGVRFSFDKPNYYAEYNKVGKNFKLVHSKPEDSLEIIPPAAPEVIDGIAVENFVRKIPDFYNKRANITDLGFTEADYTKCKEDILQLKYNFEKSEKPKEGDFYLSKNNIDFDRLLSTVDTIKQLDDEALTRLLNDVDEGPNAHLSRVGFSIENRQHITIVFRNDSSPVNALYLPWTVRIEDPITSMYAMPITRFIREICPSLLSDTDRVKVLHSFVRSLYK